jgi:hypothetical protein
MAVEQDYVAFFHQFFCFTNNPALAPFANSTSYATTSLALIGRRQYATTSYATTSLAPADQGSLRASSAILTTLITSSRAPLPTRYATIVTHMHATVRWPFYRRACLHRDVSMASSCVCFSSSPTSKPTTTLQLLVTRLTRRIFAITAASSSTATGVSSAWHVIKPWRCVALPPQLVATSLPLAACRPHTSPLITFPGLTLARVARVALLS